MREVHSLTAEKKDRVREIYEGEDVMQDLQTQEEAMLNEYRLMKQRNDDIIAELDAKLARLEKKERNQELTIQEQLEGIDRRMDYVKLKSSRV